MAAGVCLLSLSSFGQRQGNIWYFGNYAGLDFNSGVPVPLLNGAMSTNEGCATISNKQGNLLFYTNGVSVWNKNHATMPNGTGLLGNPSSTQCGVIVPRPAKNPTIYYIFSVDDHAGPSGFRYSMVDMTLNGGLGDVTVKNSLLLTPTTEKVTAVRHANQRDIWVLTHQWNTNRFYAYLVDSLTLNTTPVMSSSGSVHSGSTLNTMGYMKVSPDGDMLACAIHGQSRVEVFKFNDTTGVVSNPIVLQLPSWQLTYGIEFSPSSQFLYVTTTQSKQLHQFDMFAGNQAAIQASAVQLANYPAGGEFGGLQLARDGKIYMAVTGSPSLSVIRKPNEPAPACLYSHTSVSLGGRVSFYGLPTFVQSFFAAADFEFDYDCFGDSTSFFLTDTTEIDSVKWDFGDPSTGQDNYSALMNPKHQFSGTDSFLVSLIYFGNNIIDTLSKYVVIHPHAFLDLGNDTTICNGATVTFNVSNPEATYLWSNGSTDSTLTIGAAGIYWVQVTNYCDTLTDGIVISYAPMPTVNLGSDTAICAGGSLVLDATYPGASYLWQDSTTAATMVASQSGTYWVEVDNGCAQVRDTLDVTYIPAITSSLGNDTILCTGDQLVLSATHPGSTYLWSDGSTFSNLTVTNGGTYWVIVTNVCETGGDTVIITPMSPPVADLGPDTTVCGGASVYLNAYLQGATYLWSTGSTDSAIVASQPGNYWVEVTNACGFDTDYKDITILPPPVVQLPNDTTICPGGVIVLAIPQQQANVLWSDASTGWYLNAVNAGTYWAQAVNNCGIDQDTFVLTLFPQPVPDLGRDTFLCYDDPYILDAGAGISYLWNDGTSLQVLQAWLPGTYWVEVTNSDGCVGGDTVLLGVDCPPEVYFPTAFTPNGDGLNDVFLPSVRHVTDFRLTMFDRWGTLIFETEDPTIGWDGVHAGRRMPIGAYVFSASYHDIGGVLYRQGGNVTLIR
jgi:gliding motility-associated-like protein